MDTANGNDLEHPITKFCLALEQQRRSGADRNRSPTEFREHFFPYDEASGTDRILCHMPKEVRGPILTGWGLRGRNMAVRDDDAKVQSIVHEAFLAQDIDDATFERGLPPELVVRWTDLAEWWSFWRDGPLTHDALRTALDAAYSLGLLDARTLFDKIESQGGKLRGIQVFVDVLSKSELADWIDRIYRRGDGSPQGILDALGWETIVEKTASGVLMSVIDAVAVRSNLALERESIRPPRPIEAPLAAPVSTPPPLPRARADRELDALIQQLVSDPGGAPRAAEAPMVSVAETDDDVADVDPQELLPAPG